MSATLDADARLTRLWRVRGVAVVLACLVATLVSPVLGFSCARTEAGAASCRVVRFALGVVPYSWTTIEDVEDAGSDSTAGGMKRTRPGSSRTAYVLSESTIWLLPHGAGEPYEWTTYAHVGGDGIDIAIDELVAGTRTEPFVAWRSNGWTLLFVFVVALPMAAAMLSRPVAAWFGLPRDRWGKVIERSYVATLVAGVLLAGALAWGQVPAFVAAHLGVPTGWSADG